MTVFGGLTTRCGTGSAQCVRRAALIGVDHDENFRDELPNLALYTGGDFKVVNDVKEVYRAHPALAPHLHEQSIDASFDVTAHRRFPNNLLLAHAIGPVLLGILPESGIAVLPIFVEAIHVPTASPGRCYAH